MHQYGRVTYYIDGLSRTSSNWLRYVNCARNPREENVTYHYCYGKVYYRTFKDIAPGQELLIFYGRDYAKRLGIDMSVFPKHY